jgi:hypothetical protein
LSTSAQGYSDIIDYRVNIAEAGGSFSVLATTVELNYLVTNLISGTTYEFKVEARNIYDYSEYSSTLSLLCAFIPTVPTDV